MKFTLITLLLTALLSSLSLALVIPAGAQLANTISARAPVEVELSARIPAIAGEAGLALADTDADLEARDNRNDCGSAPYQNNLCSAGSNLKIEKGMAVLSALGVAVAGYLL